MAAPETLGCAHYKRKAKLVYPCCKKVYYCRFCHSENEDHAFVRKDIKEVICANCDLRQPFQKQCRSCSVVFGQYTCLECKLFDDVDKRQYHCKGCGICRVGGAENFFHCETCDMCLPINLREGHTCVEKVSRANCPICLEDIHCSLMPSHIPKCGHLLHNPCFTEMLKAGHFACPLCGVSMVDMKEMWESLDLEVSSTPMPPEYKFSVDILCKDCHANSKVEFHVIGLKCQSCGGYNTCRTDGKMRVNGNEGPSSPSPS